MTGRKMKILIIKLGAIGDLLMATPAIKYIRRAFPGSELHLLTGKTAGEVIEGNPDIDRQIIIDEMMFWQKKIFPLFKLIIQLRKEKYDLGINMHWSAMFNIFMLLCGIKERAGFTRFGRKRKGRDFLTYSCEFYEGEKNRQGEYVYNPVQYVNLVKAIAGITTCEKTDYRPVIYISREEKTSILPLPGNEKRNSGYFCLCPGGGDNPKTSMDIKRWPVEKYLTLAEKLLAGFNGFCVVFLGSANDNLLFGRDLDEKLIKKYAGRILNLLGKTTLKQSASIMEGAKWVITNDSAALHLAAAVHARTISIFGPTAPFDKVLNPEENRYIYKEPDCSPCYKYGSFPDCKSLKCLKSIEPFEVVDIIKKND